MYNYRFQISGYHAIAKADIAIDGITVLTGENGSGKSTIARWLYYLTTTALHFENFLYSDYYRFIQRLDRDLYILGGEYHMPGQIIIRRKIQENEDIESAENACSLITGRINRVSESLRYAVQLGEAAQSRIKRDLKRFSSGDQENEDENLNVQIESTFTRLRDNVQRYLENMENMLEKRSIGTFKTFISEQFEDTDVFPQNINLQEDGVNIIDNSMVRRLYGLDNAIYNDTPMSLNSSDAGFMNPVWKRFQSGLVTKVGEMPDKGRLIKRMLQRIIGGDIALPEDGYSIDDMIYIRQEDHLVLPVNKISTGMKTFSYIYQLLVNGYLSDRSLLLIDEPEAHLHPQWIFKLAEILVLLNKLIGVKVVIASHNPDMVAAIRTISVSQGISDNVHFYLAERSQLDKFKYVYRDLGLDIQPIFRTFNIAIERMYQYEGNGDAQ